tara:strand:+ start:2360 stop:3163 length:804 start_codon:yes stop_codon:yes gene_type:complete
MKVDKRVGITATGGRVYSVGIGQVCIPPEVDRFAFIKNCLTTGFISVQQAVGSAKHRVRCDNWTLQQIDFPENSDEFGSYVVFVTEPKSKQPFVVAHFNSAEEYNDFNENEFSLKKETDNAVVELTGNGENGSLLLNVVSKKSKKGQVDINLTNPDNTSQFNVNIKGTANFFSTGKVNVQTYDELLLEATESSEETSSSISITKDRINNDKGAEPMLLGQTTIDLLREFIQLVSTSVIMGQPLSNSVQISELASQLESLLSQKSNLD